jgi:hypothetical protein
VRTVKPRRRGVLWHCNRRTGGRWPLAWKLLALLMGLGLLAALLVVLQQGVRRGVSMRQAAQQQADVVWLCNAERGRAQRDACLQAAAR